MIITGSTIYNQFSHPCLYRVHLDLFGNKDERAEPSAAGRYLMERGNRHEKAVFDHLKAKHPKDCVEISPDPSLNHNDDIARRVIATQEAMKSGIRFIMHGFLTSQPGDFQSFEPGVGARDSEFCFRGETDLLERRDDLKSDLGDYAYVVGDVKSSRDAKFGQKMQVAFYSAILEKRQGLFPPTGFIITGASERQEFSTEDLLWTLRLFLEEEAPSCQEKEDVSFHYGPKCRFCHWRNHCKKLAEKTDDLCLVPGCKPSEKRTLVAAGIHNRKELMAQSEADLRTLGRRFGNRMDGFRDLKQKAGAQELGMSIMRQDPNTSTLGQAPAGLGAPCIFRHRGPILLVDAIPDRFHGDEAMLAFALCRPRDKSEDFGMFSFIAAEKPADCVGTLRALFVELNNTNKLLQSRRERALLVFVDPSLPYRLKRQAASLWQEHGNAPTSVERLLSESAILTNTIDRTYHLPIDTFDLDRLNQTLLRKHNGPTMTSPLEPDALRDYCSRLEGKNADDAEMALRKLDEIFADYKIDPCHAIEEPGSDLDAILVREWRETKDPAFRLLMEFNLAERLKTSKSILDVLTRLTK